MKLSSKLDALVYLLGILCIILADSGYWPLLLILGPVILGCIMVSAVSKQYER